VVNLLAREDPERVAGWTPADHPRPSMRRTGACAAPHRRQDIAQATHARLQQQLDPPDHPC